MPYDPSRTTELAMVRGMFTEHVMQALRLIAIVRFQWEEA